MSRQVRSKTEEATYRALLEAYWGEAPGVPGDRYEATLKAALEFAVDADRIDSAAVSLGFLASEELLLAGNLLARDDADAGWGWMNRAQAHAYLAHRVLCVDVWLPSQYSKQIFDVENLCAYFALSLARGSDSQLRWYAQQIYNLRRGGLADASCRAVEYVDFYWEMAIAVLVGSWPARDVLSADLGVYSELFRAVGDTERSGQALSACATYHLELAASRAPKNDVEAAHPYRSRCLGHIAYELMGWLALHKRIQSPLQVDVTHPMLLAPLLNPPPQQLFEDEILTQVRRNADTKFGVAWSMDAKNYDELWPDAQ
jgi:hypothetical protein